MPTATIITLTTPIYCLCNNFTGPYNLIESCISEVRKYLDSEKIPYTQDTGVCILLDNPLGKSTSELRSICGVIAPEKHNLPEPYFTLELSGKYLRTRTEGPLSEVRLPAYQALLNYIIDERVITENQQRIEIHQVVSGKLNLEVLIKLKE